MTWVNKPTDKADNYETITIGDTITASALRDLINNTAGRVEIVEVRGALQLVRYVNFVTNDKEQLDKVKGAFKLEAPVEKWTKVS